MSKGPTQAGDENQEAEEPLKEDAPITRRLRDRARAVEALVLSATNAALAAGHSPWAQTQSPTAPMIDPTAHSSK